VARYSAERNCFSLSGLASPVWRRTLRNREYSGHF
jgi:hypothetical protein